MCNEMQAHYHEKRRESTVNSSLQSLSQVILPNIHPISADCPISPHLTIPMARAATGVPF
jgi:hypothetical protein